MTTKSLAQTRPEPVELVHKRVEHFACGCTTTRIESVMWPNMQAANCEGHNQQLVKIVETTKFAPAFTEEDLDLPKTD